MRIDLKQKQAIVGGAMVFLEIDSRTVVMCMKRKETETHPAQCFCRFVGSTKLK